MEVLRISELHKRFGDKEVLRGLNLSVPAHSVFGFIGKNGAGKTTTMKAVLGLLRADAGEIAVNGEKVIYGQATANREIGYLPDVPEFYSYMSAEEYLRFCADIGGMERKESMQRCRELLNLVGLDEERHRIKGFSRGMKQRLGIAQALLNRPKLLICDEPTSALDPIGRKEILDLLTSVRGETTVLFSTHILSDVERICTDIALLDEGKIVMQTSLDQLKHMRRAQRFFVSASENSLSMISKRFPDAQPEESTALLFDEAICPMRDVLHFIACEGLDVQRIERMETTLEDLFLEVVGK